MISCLLVAILAGFASASDDLTVYYINTSHGDATLLESSGHFMLIDAGNKQDSSAVIDYLKSTGVGMLDYAVATSMNESAIGGMAEILKAFPVSIYADPSSSFSSTTKAAIKQQIESGQVGYQQGETGASFPFGAATIKIQNTTTSTTNASANALSLTVGVGNVSFLFSGNQDLASTPATIWAVSGQGQDVSAASFATVSPQVLIFNTGISPSAKILETLKKQKNQYLQTSKDGDVVISTDGSNYTVTTSNAKTMEKSTPVVTPTVKPVSGETISLLSPGLSGANVTKSLAS
ncbi:MAG: hypothetical protein LUQ50_15000 [Methanospirillum sp.]|uniref:ComEC/Rec2 family competence protein n=1 Tax=Methanospirillum sp. TaxID=45200 RepID=UPI00237521AA|nr:hypothetical protein [Methanospirillum sp.]MDD1730361.1 hypothetical protein [Methanospirillum sp.]